MNADGFFAIGPNEWAKACGLGLNPAVALLVLARGSGRDNITTAWSAEAIAKHTGMSWRRAKAAIDTLEAAELASGQPTKRRAPQRRKLAMPKGMQGVLWLPNTLVDGAGNEVAPITKLRQAQNPEHLAAFVELYGLQDLTGDGGLPRDLVWAPFDRERICDTGQFTVWGFTRRDTRNCNPVGPLTRFKNRKVEEHAAAWHFLLAMERMGLLQTADYLAEGESADAELIHPLSGDADADKVCDAVAEFAGALPGGYVNHAEGFDYTLPVVRHIAAPAVVGVSRLVYRPHTKLTAAWLATHRDACARHAAIYQALAAGDFQQAASIR